MRARIWHAYACELPPPHCLAHGCAGSPGFGTDLVVPPFHQRAAAARPLVPPPAPWYALYKLAEATLSCTDAGTWDGLTPTYCFSPAADAIPSQMLWDDQQYAPKQPATSSE